MAENAAKPKKSGGGKPDIATMAGLIVAFGGILGGFVLERGNPLELLQLTAGMIVLGGTIGAVMVTTPMHVLLSAAKKLTSVLFEHSHSPSDVIEEIIGYASKARRNSIVSLESDLDNVSDPFLRKALSLAVDGTDLNALRSMLELDMALEEKSAEAEAKVYEAAGGYSPTIGIIGAVLGLIQVMKNLQNIDEVGHGIATAFVATVYGVGVANLFFLPAANKLKARAHAAMHNKELMIEGISGIVEGLNPKLIRVKLEAFAREDAKKSAPEKKGAAKGAPQPATAKGQ